MVHGNTQGRVYTIVLRYPFARATTTNHVTVWWVPPVVCGTLLVQVKVAGLGHDLAHHAKAGPPRGGAWYPPTNVPSGLPIPHGWIM